ncbi:MAG: hypothetical protein ACT4OK_12680 [Gemmobacter sp.]
MPIRLAATALALLPLPVLAEPAFAPGTHGEPFTVQGLVQGCMADEEGAFCVVNAEGWRWLVDAAGPTPPDLYRMLTVLPVNAPVEMTGDMIEMGDITVMTAVSDLTQGRDEHARLRALMQGTWTYSSGEATVQIDGSEWSVTVGGNLTGIALLQLRADCGDGVAAGGTVITLAEMGGDPEAVTCYRVAQAALDRMALVDRSGAGEMLMTRAP